MSEWCKALTVISKVYAEIGNAFWVLFTEVYSTQTRATFGGDISLEVLVALDADVENKYSGTMLLLKE